MAKPQLVTPLDLVDAIPDFEGLPVVCVGVEVPGISGGLNEALTVSPVVLHHGEEFALLIRGRVRKINHEPVDKEELDGAQRRIQVGTVAEAGFVPVDAVDGLLDAQRKAIDEARIAAERREGIHRLPLAEAGGDEDDPEQAMTRAHNQGVHSDGLRRECALCHLEAEFAAEENGTTVEQEFEARTPPA